MLKTSSGTPLDRVLGPSLLATLALVAAPATADEGIYVVDIDAGTGAGGALFRVDAESGDRSLVSDFGDDGQGDLGVDPIGLALEAGGAVLVSDPNAGTGNAGALFRVDPASGDRSLVSDFGDDVQGPLGNEPIELALEAGGTVLVTDANAGTAFNTGALFRVDAASGDRSLVSDFGDPVQGPLGNKPFGLAVEATGTVLVTDAGAVTGFFSGALFRVDAASGDRSLVSDFGNPAHGPLGVDPIGLALEAGGAALVIDANAGTGNAGALLRVDRLSGRRTVLSDFGSAGQGTLGADPVGVAVVVPTCHGRLPTLVGDNGNNVLIGSPRADVILGRGGADRIDGRGGNDRICGANGNDTLRGGTGNDRLDGGTGRDRLDGGKGIDRLAGGKGRDRCKGEVEVGCER